MICFTIKEKENMGNVVTKTIKNTVVTFTSQTEDRRNKVSIDLEIDLESKEYRIINSHMKIQTNCDAIAVQTNLMLQADEYAKNVLYRGGTLD